ncbi:MAG TPA: four helix bundle protein [Thermoanaerobaculia bacterium]|nr:four helix bundle protein [Thermoanaerobaculia bacterium]
MRSYRDLHVWQEARVLAREIYETTGSYPRAEMFGLVQQLRRAAVSIICNIAEGQGRWSRRDQVNFYFIARGSALEVETQLLISADLGYISPEAAQPLISRAQRIARMLNGLIRRSRHAGQPPPPPSPEP